MLNPGTCEALSTYPQACPQGVDLLGRHAIQLGRGQGNDHEEHESRTRSEQDETGSSPAADAQVASSVGADLRRPKATEVKSRRLMSGDASAYVALSGDGG